MATDPVPFSEKNFMEIALEQEKNALEFFESDMFQTIFGGTGMMSEEYLDEKRKAVAALEKNIENDVYDETEGFITFVDEEK